MTKKDWVLIWSWALFLALAGPFLVSAKDTALVLLGVAIFIALVWLTQRRLKPIILEKFK